MELTFLNYPWEEYELTKVKTGEKIFYKGHLYNEIYVQKFWVDFFVKHSVYHRNGMCLRESLKKD